MRALIRLLKPSGRCLELSNPIISSAQRQSFVPNLGKMTSISTSTSTSNLQENNLSEQQLKAKLIEKGKRASAYQAVDENIDQVSLAWMTYLIELLSWILGVGRHSSRLELSESAVDPPSCLPSSAWVRCSSTWALRFLVDLKSFFLKSRASQERKTGRHLRAIVIPVQAAPHQTQSQTDRLGNGDQCEPIA